MSSTVKTSFSAEFALVKNERDIALQRLDLIKRELKNYENCNDYEVAFVCHKVLEWYDAPILLDEDFK